MTPEEVKAWVVRKSVITNPNKKYWSASVTLAGMDINGIGSTIENAYKDLANQIFNSPYYRSNLLNLQSNNQRP